MCNSFGEYYLIKIELYLYIFIFIRLFETRQEVTLHQCLIFTSNFFRCDTIDAIGIISNSYQKRSKENGHIKAISFLPSCYICRARDAFGELIWRIKFFIFNKFAESLSTLFVVIELQKS